MFTPGFIPLPRTSRSVEVYQPRSRLYTNESLPQSNIFEYWKSKWQTSTPDHRLSLVTMTLILSYHRLNSQVN